MLDSSPPPPESEHPAAPSPTARFREAVPDYLHLIRLGGGPSVVETQKSLERWTSRWAWKRLEDLSPEDVQKLLRALAREGLSRQDREKEKTRLRLFYRWARRRGHATHCPLDEPGSSPQARPPDPVVWSIVEQRRLLDACRGRFTVVPRQAARAHRSRPPRRARTTGTPQPLAAQTVPEYLHPLVFLGLRTGLRQDALLGLEWSHIHLYRRRLLILPRPGSHSHGRPTDVPVSKDVLALLMNLYRHARRLQPVPPRVLDAVGLPLWNDEPHVREVLLAFRTVRRRAAVPEGDFHSLRLTFLWNCACAGIPRVAAARLCDWHEGDDLLDAVYSGRLSRPSQPRLAIPGR